MNIQLPFDVVAVGYKESRPYCWEQVFWSEFAQFKGTEREFLSEGYAYSYSDAEPHRRMILRDQRSPEWIKAHNLAHLESIRARACNRS